MISGFIQNHPFWSLFLLIVWQLLVSLTYASLARTAFQRVLILTLTAFCGGLGGLFGTIYYGERQPAFHLSTYGSAVFVGSLSSMLILIFIILSFLASIFSWFTHLF